VARLSAPLARQAELTATLPGQCLYRAQGYVAAAPIKHPVGDGLTIELVPMRKPLG
jgi:hypothetical protein